MQTPEEVQNEFKKEGVELSVEEIEILGSMINKSLEKDRRPLTEKELLEIAGGSVFGQGMKMTLQLPWVVLDNGLKKGKVRVIERAAGMIAGQGLIALTGAGVAWAIKDREKLRISLKVNLKN